MRNTAPINFDSIYYNALPFYQDRMDIMSLSSMMVGELGDWFSDLWKGSSTVLILNVDSLHLEKFRRLYFLSKNFERTHGAKSLAIGFPIGIDTNESDLVFAPLFILQIGLEPVLGNEMQWKIRLLPGAPVKPNYRVFRHLKLKFELDFLDKAESLSRKLGLGGTFDGLIAFGKELSERLHFESFDFDGLQPCPGIDEIGSISERGALYWTAVLGLFPPQDFVRNEDLPKPELKFSKQELEAPSFLPIPLNADNLEIANALEEISRNKIVVIKEKMNASHRQLVVNLILNALAEKKKCLVISPYSASLKKMQDAVSKAGLFQLHYLLVDAIHDAAPFLELLKTAGSGSNVEPEFDEHDFKVKKNKYARAKNELLTSYQSARQPIFGDYNWAETVGLWLWASKDVKQDLLGSHLNPRDFEFSFEAFENLNETVGESQQLFKTVNTLNHPLSALERSTFLEMDEEKARHYISGKVSERLRLASALQKEIIGTISQYSSALRNDYEKQYSELYRLANQLKKKHESLSDSLGKDFQKARSKAIGFTLIFSRKRKSVHSAQGELAVLFQQLLAKWNKLRLFEFDFHPCNEGYHTAAVESETAKFLNALKSWKSSLDEQLNDHILRLNHKTVLPHLDAEGRIKQVEIKLENFVLELNETKIFNQVFENKTLTLPQRQKYLEHIVEMLETVSLNMRDFGLFYRWQKYWLQLKEPPQQLIKALVKVKPDDWVAAFRFWYLHQVLLLNADEHLQAGSQSLSDSTESWMELKTQLLPQVLKTWHKEQNLQRNALKKSDSKFYKSLFGKAKARDNRLPELQTHFDKAFDCLTTYFPVLFVTPHVARNILYSGKGKFDFVIYSDGHRFSIEDASAISNLGEQLVICGRDEELGLESSLISYSINNEVPVVDSDGQLQQISKILFQEGKLIETGAVVNTFVAGRFDEFESTNIVEAQSVVKLLNHIKPNENRVFPAIGIVAMTPEQRDLIQTQLLKIKQENNLGSEKILQLERNGLGVFYIEDLYGMSFDELVVSFTFGPVDQSGKLTRKLSYLNTTNGVLALRNLVAHATRQTTFIHSLPENVILTSRINKSEKGLYLLANHIALSDALTSGNEDFLEEIKNALGLRLPENKNQSKFLQEVKRQLHAYLDKEKIAFARMPVGIHKPLFIKPKFVVQQDGFFSSLRTTFGPWEMAMQNEIAKMGMDFRAEWAVNWFKNPKLNERQLAGFLLKNTQIEKEKEMTGEKDK